MKTRDLLALQERLLPRFPGFMAQNNLMFVSPLEHTLRGFHFESSAFEKRNFYVDVFFLPLCVPTASAHFTFGHRLSRLWAADEPNLDEALASVMQGEAPLLASLRKPADVARALEPLTKPNAAGYVNPRCYEALAYVLVQADAAAAAASVIDTLLRSADQTVGWECEVASRARQLQAILLENPTAAQQQLTDWEAQSVRNLGLEAFS